MAFIPAGGLRGMIAALYSGGRYGVNGNAKCWNAALVRLAHSHWARRARCASVAGCPYGGACAGCRRADSGGALTAPQASEGQPPLVHGVPLRRLSGGCGHRVRVRDTDPPRAMSRRPPRSSRPRTGPCASGSARGSAPTRVVCPSQIRPRCDASRTLRFNVDLPANHPGPGRRRRA